MPDPLQRPGLDPSADISECLDRGLDQLLHLEPVDLPVISLRVREQLLAYIELLAKWNRVYNLTAVRDKVAMVDRHLLDSLVMRRWLPDQAVAADRFDVLDVGTGAGLPVLPLAMIRPDLRFLSIESNGKKTRFQQQAMLELGLSNVTVMQQRVENVSETAQLVLSRAFAAPLDFLNMAESLCMTGDRVAIMLGQAERLPEPLPPAYELLELTAVEVPGTESARHVAVCRRQAG